MSTGEHCLGGSSARRLQHRESDTGYDKRRRSSDSALARLSQTAVCDTRARTPSSTRRRVSYPVSDSLCCRRRANEHGPETRADKPAAVGPGFPSATRGGPGLLRHDTLSDEDL